METVRGGLISLKVLFSINSHLLASSDWVIKNCTIILFLTTSVISVGKLMVHDTPITVGNLGSGVLPNINRKSQGAGLKCSTGYYQQVTWKDKKQQCLSQFFSTNFDTSTMTQPQTWKPVVFRVGPLLQIEILCVNYDVWSFVSAALCIIYLSTEQHTDCCSYTRRSSSKEPDISLRSRWKESRVKRRVNIELVFAVNANVAQCVNKPVFAGDVSLINFLMS